jgi:hypothetical protein
VLSSTPTPEIQEIKPELEQIYLLYTGLLGQTGSESGAGGRLLYAGEPDEPGTRLLRAANIAGAASLAASADARALRQAMREGAVDFVVNSLDEALRILKNEIRKRQPVAVGVSVFPTLLLDEMLERGVLPDLLAPSLPSAPALETFSTQGARRAEPTALPTGIRFLVLPIPAAWSQQTATFDALLQDCLPADDALNRRWLRLAPRYLASSARRLRSVACNDQTAAKLTECVNRTPPE